MPYDTLCVSDEIKVPQRAFTLTLRVDGDTAQDLARSLYHLGDQIERGELTTGTFGSPTTGGSYELLSIDKPHEKYFEELHAYLAARRASSEKSDHK